MPRISGDEWAEFESEIILDAQSNEVLNFKQLAYKFNITYVAAVARVGYLRRRGKLPWPEPEKRIEKQRRPYTSEELKVLKYMIEHGATMVQIANELNRTYRSVRNKAHREEKNGHITPRVNQPDVSELDRFICAIKLDYRDNVSNYNELAKQFNLTKKQAWDRVRSIRNRGLLIRGFGNNTTSTTAFMHYQEREFKIWETRNKERKLHP